MTAILAGSAIFMGSGITFVFPFLFILIIEKLFIPVEEQKLERVFGEVYLEYKKTVRKWV
jgi:protein-S-isoprenylcysteine O-methyltransferase Ste14